MYRFLNKYLIDYLLTEPLRSDVSLILRCDLKGLKKSVVYFFVDGWLFRVVQLYITHGNKYLCIANPSKSIETIVFTVVYYTLKSTTALNRSATMWRGKNLKFWKKKMTNELMVVVLVVVVIFQFNTRIVFIFNYSWRLNTDETNDFLDFYLQSTTIESGPYKILLAYD